MLVYNLMALLITPVCLFCLNLPEYKTVCIQYVKVVLILCLSSVFHSILRLFHVQDTQISPCVTQKCFLLCLYLGIISESRNEVSFPTWFLDSAIAYKLTILYIMHIIVVLPLLV